MSAHLTATLKCNTCFQNWTITEYPRTDAVISVANALLSARCPNCCGIRSRVQTMRFCSVTRIDAEPQRAAEGEPGA